MSPGILITSAFKLYSYLNVDIIPCPMSFTVLLHLTLMYILSILYFLIARLHTGACSQVAIRYLPLGCPLHISSHMLPPSEVLNGTQHLCQHMQHLQISPWCPVSEDWLLHFFIRFLLGPRPSLLSELLSAA